MPTATTTAAAAKASAGVGTAEPVTRSATQRTTGKVAGKLAAAKTAAKTPGKTTGSTAVTAKKVTAAAVAATKPKPVVTKTVVTKAVVEATAPAVSAVIAVTNPAAEKPVRSVRTGSRPGTQPRVIADPISPGSRSHGIGPGYPGWQPGDATERDAALAALWADYKAHGGRELRDRILVHYSPLVKYVAGKVGSGLPNTIEQADLVSYGIFGLIDAIEKFEPERLFKFETYALARIRGAIIDELRSVDWVPRSVRNKAREIERAYVALEAKTHRSPTEDEVAEYLGVEVRDLRHTFGQVSFTNMAALDELLHGGSEGQDGFSLGETLVDARVELPGEAYDQYEASEALAKAVASLPERDKIVITLYYFEGLTLAEIGKVLGVTESRVCQMHTKATVTLRSKLSAIA